MGLTFLTSPTTLLQIAFTLGILLAAVWLGVVAVKNQRKEHLFWIVPFVLARAVGGAVPYLVFALQRSMPTQETILIAGVFSLISNAMSLCAVIALVIVIWRSLDQVQTERTGYRTHP